tara:strand:+ start:312 stop:578 length:267 start_codon:yes stop_codon:yes gene_type:complete
MGRVVKTHSTYIDGLINWCNKIAKNNKIKTITPGVIGKTKGTFNKLIIRITRKTNTGYKLVARKGSTFQEVYVVTNLNKKDLELIIND